MLIILKFPTRIPKLVHNCTYLPNAFTLYCELPTPNLNPFFFSFQNVDHKMKYKSKKGQLPFVEVNGEEVADSAIIIKELGQRYNQDLDAGLSAEQRNVAHATISMIENHFAW